MRRQWRAVFAVVALASAIAACREGPQEANLKIRQETCGGEFTGWAVTNGASRCYDITMLGGRTYKSDCDVDFQCVDSDGKADGPALQLGCKKNVSGDICCGPRSVQLKATCKKASTESQRCEWEFSRS